MARTRVPNRRLRALVEEAGWTQAGLARAINAVGAEIGLSLHYDRSSVAHWLSGSRPGREALPLLYEVLRRRLGRVVTPEQAGFGAAAPVVPAQHTNAADNGLSDLLHNLARLLPYRPADAWPGNRGALTVPRQRQAAPPQDVRPTGPASTAVGFFAETWLAQGGGFARTTLRTYLAEAVAGRLREPEPSAHREWCAEASRLTLLLGRMYADDLRHGAAQRCFVTARDLALAVGHQDLAVIAVRTMSTQAYALGHLRIADGAARAAVRGGRATPLEVRAFAQAQLAVTTASRGERGEALAALRTAEAAVGGGGDGRHAFDSYARADFEFQRAETLLVLGDGAEAARALEHALSTRSASDRRGLALTRLRLAQVQLSLGRVDEVRRHEQALRGELEGLRSESGIQRLHALQRSLRRFADRAARE
ncbi:hypothetical protein OK074_7931 [Actinobacteria bacterium OK074]|nr:hypothetical protein OK074_7931 [Actinobacteria bacterium OK074]